MRKLEKKPPVFLKANWHDIAMLTYEVPESILRKYLPNGLELDSWNGKYFVTLVAFVFRKTSIIQIPAFFHRNFEEINLRFYVRKLVDNKMRRGVVFIKEIVRKPMVTFIAKHFYKENYITLPTFHNILISDQQRKVTYGWTTGNSDNVIEITVFGNPSIPKSETLSSFVIEHYWGYSKQKNKTIDYEVEHIPWRIWEDTNYRFKCDVSEIYGKEFQPYITEKPSSVIVVEGSSVNVRFGKELKN